MNNAQVKQARFAEDYAYIIDSDGKKVEFNDPRVVHILSTDIDPYTKRMLARVFQRRGWRFRSTGETNHEVLQHAKKLCSGRECLPFASIAGATYRDILTNREIDEISIYYSLDVEDNNCQAGVWSVVWEEFARRINLRNVVFLADANLSNNYLGQGDSFAFEVITAAVVGQLLTEAKNSLKCVAHDKDMAMKIFEDEADRVIESSQRGITAVDSALKKWVENITKVPLKTTVEETPKVLLSGGFEVEFLHYPITEYFLEQSIIPKGVCLCEFAEVLLSTVVVTYGNKRGSIPLKQHFSIPSLILSLFKWRNNRKEALTALKARLQMGVIEFLMKRFRKIMEKSGLLFDVHIPFQKIIEEGHKYVSYNALNIPTVTTGRYLHSIKAGVFDGLVNVAVFNCQQSKNSQAIIQPLANRSDIPYAAIDLEGPGISVNQRRLLETVAVQAKRLRKMKNEGQRQG